MKYKIVGDSCCDFTKEELKSKRFVSVPLRLIVGETELLDDASLNIEDFMNLLDSTDEASKSACPSPDAYMQAYEGAKNVFVVTLSAKLSGSYNAAELAKDLFLEDHMDVNIHVFDSKTAAAGQYIICKKIEECVEAGMSYQNVVDTVEAFIERQETVFVLDDLSVMIKNGRVSRLKGNIASVLSIKPVLIGIDGEIHQADQGRGMNKALNLLLGYIKKSNYDKDNLVVISCTDAVSINRCKNVRKILMEEFGFKNVTLLEGHGLTTMYANRGGVIVTYFKK